jgi:RNA polymerase sigma-70 factor (ECF subfamily)
VEAHSAVAWRTARALLLDRAATEDAVQEAWIDAWRGLPSFDPSRPFRPWLLAIVANRCRMIARRRTLATITLENDTVEQLPGEDDVAEALLRREADVELEVALERLPMEQQHILELRYFAELDLAEIAVVLDAPLGTVKSRLHRALAALRVSLAATCDVAPGKGNAR